MATKVLPSQRQFKQFEEQVILGQLTLPEVVRRGAQLMLQHAVELEMTEYLGREYYRNDPEATAVRGRRNGYHARPIRTGEGSLEIQVPEARDVPPGTPRFQSKILEAYGSRTESLEILITRMYVAGMSTRDIETALEDTTHYPPPPPGRLPRTRNHPPSAASSPGEEARAPGVAATPRRAPPFAGSSGRLTVLSPRRLD